MIKLLSNIKTKNYIIRKNYIILLYNYIIKSAFINMSCLSTQSFFLLKSD